MAAGGVNNINDPSDLYAPKSALASNTAIMGKSADQMDMDDFFKLLTAQMSNQDMMNPQSNTEFIAQMAQFSSLQGIKTLQEYQLSSYAVSYVGKNVTIANVDDNGKMQTIEGKVDHVAFYDGKPQVVVNGKAYDLHTVMEINAEPKTTDPVDDADKTDYQKAVDKYLGMRVTLKLKDKDGKEMEVIGQVDSIRANKDGGFNVVVNGREYSEEYVEDIEDGDSTIEEGSDAEELMDATDRYYGEMVKMTYPGENGEPAEVEGLVTLVCRKEDGIYVRIGADDYRVKDSGISFI